MEDFRRLNNRVLEIQNLKEQTKVLNTYKKSALEELGTIVYTNILQGISEEKKVKEMCDLSHNQMVFPESEAAIKILSPPSDEPSLRLHLLY